MLQRTFAFPVAGFGDPKLTWLRRPKGLISKSISRLARRPGAGSYHRVVGAGRAIPPRLALATCYVSLLRSRVRVGPMLRLWIAVSLRVSLQVVVGRPT